MLKISFDSNVKFKGKCDILINTRKPVLFDIVNEKHIIYGSYKLKPEVDLDFNFKFVLETPYGEEINIPASKRTILNAISYIMAKESNYSEEKLKEIVDYINKSDSYVNEEEDE